MPYLLDTNICIYIIKKAPQAVLDKFNSISPEQIAISTISIAELEYGARKSSQIDNNLRSLRKFLSPFKILNFDDQAATEYGVIKAALAINGTPIGPMDSLIAAHARSINYTLVTNNTKEFARVSGLILENWV